MIYRCWNIPPTNWRFWIAMTLVVKAENLIRNRVSTKRQAFPEVSWSWIKCKSISICFVLTWKTGLVARDHALKLSHHEIGLLLLEVTSSNINWLSQIISDAAWARAQYSDFVLEWATALCFLEDHETKLLPTKTQYAATNLPSSILEAESSFENAVIDYHSPPH